MSRRRSSLDPEAEIRAVESLGEKIAAHFGVALTEVRYANYRFHNGDRWTIHIGWERRINGAWQRNRGCRPRRRSDRAKKVIDEES